MLLINFLYVLIVLCILLFASKSLLLKFKNSIVIDVVLSIIIFFALAYILSFSSFLTNDSVKAYIDTIIHMLQVMLIFLAGIVMIYTIIGFFGKRYSLRVDNFNIGGINIFFDKSNEIFIKTVGTFVASKRSLFSFNKKRDNIDDVLTAYYETYKFVKENLELLDSKKDEKLYRMSTEILRKLNNFLTKHQSDYRRWYGKISADDYIEDSKKDKIRVHETTIEEVQVHYYRYQELLEDIMKINEYFSQSIIKENLEIKYFDWSEEYNA